MSSDRIGLGPADARAGDELFFLEGGKTRFVLRWTGRGPSTSDAYYEGVGDCYLPSMMAGEAMNDPRIQVEWGRCLFV
jgi:hypothetical protein